MCDFKDLENLLHATKFDADNAISKRKQSNFYADTNALLVFERISRNTAQAKNLLEKIKKKYSIMENY